MVYIVQNDQHSDGEVLGVFRTLRAAVQRASEFEVETRGCCDVFWMDVPDEDEEDDSGADEVPSISQRFGEAELLAMSPAFKERVEDRREAAARVREVASTRKEADEAEALARYKRTSAKGAGLLSQLEATCRAEHSNAWEEALVCGGMTLEAYKARVRAAVDLLKTLEWDVREHAAAGQYSEHDAVSALRDRVKTWQQSVTM